MQDIFHELLSWLSPEKILQVGGLAMLIFIIFAESGLFFGFFLPGDSLLFIAGLTCATNTFHENIVVILLTCTVASVLGNYVGYWFGRKTGPALFKRDDSLIFKKKYIETARDFYGKRGGLALILGRFMPIIRTFVPIFAGIVELDFKKFTYYNILGGSLWIFSMTLAGYFLGKSFPQVKDYLEFIVIGIIFVSTIPVIRAFLSKQIQKVKDKRQIKA